MSMGYAAIYNGGNKNKSSSELLDKTISYLSDLEREGIKFECFFSQLKFAIKKRTYKVLFNDRYKDMTDIQMDILLKLDEIKKEVDGIIADYRGEIVKKEFGAIFGKLKKPLALLEHYRQNLYEQEYHKTFCERFIGSKFDFKRSILPQKDCKVITFLENLFIRDIYLLGENSEKHSFRSLQKTFKSKGNNGEDLSAYIRSNTQFGERVSQIEKLKREGKRVFVIIPHPSYLGAVIPRYVMMKLGFNEIAQNWNFLCGPRVLANKVLNRGVRTIGNLYMTLPSSDTTPIKTGGLQKQFRPQLTKTARIIQGKTDNIAWEIGEENDYNNTKGEVFVVAPEGSRSNERDDGTIELKHCSPAFLNFVQQGDYIVCMSQTGSQTILKNGSKIPRPGKVGVSLGKPFEITDIHKSNHAKTMVEIMRKMEDLPSMHKMVFPFQYNVKTQQLEEKSC